MSLTPEAPVRHFASAEDGDILFQRRYRRDTSVILFCFFQFTCVCLFLRDSSCAVLLSIRFRVDCVCHCMAEQPYCIYDPDPCVVLGAHGVCISRWRHRQGHWLGQVEVGETIRVRRRTGTRYYTFVHEGRTSRRMRVVCIWYRAAASLPVFLIVYSLMY